ncbi:MAG: sigma factor-like helix-turn-helix DNA-binding protein, partial [Negativicoccus succinicivorans]|nr:sigma factor-like helix-turn-helix DNA-binding protein [Negativicoccus succinicivorans]
VLPYATSGNKKSALADFVSTYSSISQAVPRVLSKLELRVLLYYLRGLSYETIAQRIGRPVKTVDNAIQRMKRKMELYFRNH